LLCCLQLQCEKMLFLFYRVFVDEFLLPCAFINWGTKPRLIKKLGCKDTSIF
jgi:hypothetical protein